MSVVVLIKSPFTLNVFLLLHGQCMVMGPVLAKVLHHATEASVGKTAIAE